MIRVLMRHRSPLAASLWLALALGCFIASPASARTLQIEAVPSQTSPLPVTTDEDAKANNGIRSPRALLSAFLKDVHQESGSNPDAAATLFSATVLPPTDAIRDRLFESLDTIVAYLGWSEAGALDLVPDANDAGNGIFRIFPFTGDEDSEVARKSRLLENALDGDWTIAFVRNDIGEWRFASETVVPAEIDRVIETIDDLRRTSGDTSVQVGSLSEWVAIEAPEWMLQKVAFVKVWQWIGLGIIILVGLVLDLVVRFVAIRSLRRATKRIGRGTDDLVVRRTARAMGVVAATLSWLLLLNLLDLSITAFSILQPAAKFASLLALFWLGWRLADYIGEIFSGHAAASDTKIDDILVPMIRKSVKVFLVIFALLNLSPFLGLNLGPLLAAIGVGSFGFAFAFKNSLENFFGSVTVILDRPFQVGDWVVVDGVEGEVESVGLRSTRIRTFYNSLVTMPNSNLVTQQVDNYGMRKYRRWSTKVGILYGTPINRIDAFCEAIRQLIREHPYTRKDYYQVWLNSFGDSALEILVYVFWQAPNWQTELRERHRFMLDIMRVAEQLGVEFAFPSQTIYLERGSERAVPRSAGLDEGSEVETMRRGREAARTVTADADWRAEHPNPYRFLDAEETERIDRASTDTGANEVQKRIERQPPRGLPREGGEDPDNPDFTEQRSAGGE